MSAVTIQEHSPWSVHHLVSDYLTRDNDPDVKPPSLSSLYPLRPGEGHWPEFYQEVSGILWGGDGGSSPLAHSTRDLIYVPPDDAEIAEELREELEQMRRYLRALRELARRYAERLQGVGLGRMSFDVALERLRFLLVISAAVNHRHAQLAQKLPSRFSVGADYFLLMVLRRHDPNFDASADVLGWALPTLTADPSLDLRGVRRLTFPIFTLGEVRSHYDEVVSRAAITPREGETGEAFADRYIDVLKGMFLLAGMCLEHGVDRIPGEVAARPHASLAFLRDRGPEYWQDWGALLNSVWNIFRP